MSTVNDKLFDLKALEAFMAAMSCGSMTRAAEQLGIGQPAVTRLVKDLEAAAGFQMFHRNGPRISPTDRGMRFYEEVQGLVSGLRQIGQRAEEIRENRPPAIEIAATPTMAGGLSGPTLRFLGADLPDHINVQTMGAEYVIRAVRSRTAEFGIAAYPLDHAGLSRHVVCESRLVAVVAADSPLAGDGGPVPMSVFGSERLVTVGNAFRIRHTIDVALERAEVSPLADFSTNASLNAMMAAREGLGVAILDPVTAYGIPVEGVKVLPLETALPYLWVLLSDANRALSRPLNAFVDAFRESCRATVPDCQFLDPSDPDIARRIELNPRT